MLPKNGRSFPCQSANKKCDRSKTACICNGPIHSCLNFHDEDCKPDNVGAYKNTRSPTANSSCSENTLSCLSNWACWLCNFFPSTTFLITLNHLDIMAIYSNTFCVFPLNGSNLTSTRSVGLCKYTNLKGEYPMLGVTNVL